jgi:2'-5' RNA ligase
MKTDPIIRAFVALEISDEVRDGLERIKDGLWSPELRVKWVEPHNMHLTILFLGDILESQAREFAGLLEQVARFTDPFQYDVEKIGFSGSHTSPRMVWAGVPKPSELMDLHMRVLGVAKQVGLAVEKRPFKAHLTLGRFRPSSGTNRLVARVKELAGAQFGTVLVDSLLFYKSTLTPQGPIYTVMKRVKLGKRGEEKRT